MHLGLTCLKGKDVASIINAKIPILILCKKIYPSEFLSHLRNLKFLVGSVEALSHNAGIHKPRTLDAQTHPHSHSSLTSAA